ncbi:hypothetical protein IJI99_01750 [bacterium]|nr:hypothetical protein [bacterium]
MPNSNNAFSVLRRSIAGRDYTQTQKTETEEGRREVPPILVLPPGMEAREFVARVEEAYGLNYAKERVYSDDDTKAKMEHSFDLMDEGYVDLTLFDYRRASDMFSLALILYDNYFYHFCLAYSRNSLGDFEGALYHLRIAMTQLREKQEVPDEITYMVQEANFTEEYYALFLRTLIFTGNMEEAKKLADFVLENKIFIDGEYALDAASVFGLFDEKQYAAKLLETIKSDLEKEKDPEIKKHLTEFIKRILTPNFTDESAQVDKNK